MSTQTGFQKYKNGLKAIICLNLLDAIFTIWWVIGEWAVEANPLMAVLLSKSPALFMGYKILLVHLCVGLLWRFRKVRFARLSIIPVLITYIGIVVFHICSAVVIFT